MHVLLVEPQYFTTYPPLGLLKLATYHKAKRDIVELVRGCPPPSRRPDKIYVTSLYTYAWKPVHAAVMYYKRLYPKVPIHLGGVYASIFPEHARKCNPDRLHIGPWEELDQLLPDYSMVEGPPWNWKDKSLLFSSRGCTRSCQFCAVPKVEGGIHQVLTQVSPHLYPGHTELVFWDNNFLAAPKAQEILRELSETSNLKKTDFCQAVDARLVAPQVAQALRKAKTNPVRLSYDHGEQRGAVYRAIKHLREAGYASYSLFAYMLYNFQETPEEFLDRLIDMVEWGATSYPQRYEPLDSLKRNQHISSHWTKEQLDMVPNLRRVLGSKGAIVPTEAIKKKFFNAKSFEEAFSLDLKPRRKPPLHILSHKTPGWEGRNA